MAGIASWFDKRLEKIRQLSKCHLILFITVKFLAGAALGLLLAMWLPIWTWLIFIVVALIIAIPLYIKIWGK